MTIDWNHFMPWASLAGGALIGLAAVMLMAVRGRIAGISGIVAGLLQFSNVPAGHFSWRLAFLAGVLVSGAAATLLFAPPEVRISVDDGMLVMAGLLVGFGTRMGSGCTSGHGVCGLGRLSIRSLIATLSFMASGFITAGVLLHLL